MKFVWLFSENISIEPSCELPFCVWFIRLELLTADSLHCYNDLIASVRSEIWWAIVYFLVLPV